MTTTDYAGILSAILDAPDDDLPRLAMADLLDERGEPGDAERAEFIRCQVMLAAHEAGKSGSEVGQGPPWPGYLMFSRRQELQRRLEAVWYAPARGFDSGTVPLDWLATIGEIPEDVTATYVAVRRGFVSEVRCSLVLWQQHGGAIVGHHPVTKVVTEKKPRLRQQVSVTQGVGVTQSEWGWFMGGFDALWPTSANEDLPGDLYHLLGGEPEPRIYGWWKYYPTEQAAWDAFHKAALLWVKTKPPVDPPSTPGV